MSLAQQLLDPRAGRAVLGRSPTSEPLVRWGTALHDRFMLPHFVWADFAERARAISPTPALPDAGRVVRCRISSSASRCSARCERAGVQLELRQALEPWQVLGEESPAGGTTRPVDSSLERVQVMRHAARPAERYVVTCNGYPLPLRRHRARGEAVAGVRFRAWQPPQCLHPNIAPHVPLTFDLVDTWTGRSIGGCRYHVAHPGGRTSTVLPVNALEAEGRRRAALREHRPHGGRGASAARQASARDFPLTLDLRHVAVTRRWLTLGAGVGVAFAPLCDESDVRQIGEASRSLRPAGGSWQGRAGRAIRRSTSAGRHMRNSER